MQIAPLSILTLGDKRLKQESLPVTQFDSTLKDLCEAMFVTLKSKNGLGLAAVQIGELVQVFITNLPDDEPRIFINPSIIATSENYVWHEEGCLSIPNYYDHVRRPEAVTIQAFNLKGKPFQLSATRLLARVLQHEMDHLKGILFIDRLPKPQIKSKAIKDAPHNIKA